MNGEPGAWSLWRLVFAAESPIHIGWHELGLIQRTRYWIPARNFWGAAIANTARRRDGESVADAYKRATEYVNASLRFTNFYPALDPSIAGGGFRPGYLVDQGLVYGNQQGADLERAWVYSQTSAALAPGQLSAERGALHESEYLAPRGRNTHADSGGGAARLHFEGYALARNAETAEGLRPALALSMVGADRRYGWGRLRLLPGEAGISPAGAMFGDYGPCGEVSGRAEGDPRDPVVESDGPANLPAYLIADGITGIEGDLEAVGGRDWNAKGSGGSVRTPKLCWMPGSVCADGRRFAIDPQGLWRRADG